MAKEKKPRFNPRRKKGQVTRKSFNLVYSFFVKSTRDADDNMRPTKQGFIDRQLLLKHQYRHALIDIEAKRRAAIDKLVGPRVPAVVAAHAEAKLRVQEKEAEINLINQRARRKTAPPALRAELAALRKIAKEKAKVMYLAKREVYDSASFKEQQKVIAEAVKLEKKALRARFSKQLGLFWGNYLVVERGADGLHKGPLAKKHPFSDTRNTVSAQLQKKNSVLDVTLGRNGYFQMTLPPAAAWDDATPRGERVRLRRCKARLYLGENATGQEVWTDIQFTMSRPIPTDCRITWVTLARERVERKYRWRLNLSVAREAPFRELAASGVVAVNLGWRVKEEGLRVGYWVGDDGAKGEIELPQRLIELRRKIDDLCGIRKNNFNEVKGLLCAWLAEQPVLPLFMENRRAGIPRWEAAGRLHQLYYEWAGQQLDGDAEIFKIVEAWHKQDRHLHQWAAFRFRRFDRLRKLHYEAAVKMLRERYRTLKIDEMNVEVINRRPDVGVNDTQLAARYNAKMAAVGELRLKLKQSMDPSYVPDKFMTMSCQNCGHIDRDIKAREQIMVTCPNCGVTYDQDERNCLNKLAYVPPPETEGAETPEPPIIPLDERRIDPIRPDGEEGLTA